MPSAAVHRAPEHLGTLPELPEDVLLDLSIVIVSYNTASLLAACLRSLERALRLTPLSRGAEVWVVDNASTDGSAALVREQFPWVRLIANGTNVGFSAASNQALRQARGRYLLLLNPDTEVLGTALHVLTAYLDAHPEVGMATARLVNPDGTHQHSAFRFPGLVQLFLDLFPLHPRLEHSWANGRYPPQAYAAPFEIEHPLGACMFVRREAVARVGLLDEGYFLYCEELDWSWRMRAAGWRVVCVPEAVVLHHGGASTRQLRSASFVMLYRSRLRFLRRFAPALIWAAARLLIMLGMVKETLKALWEERRGRISTRERATWVRACWAVFLLAWRGEEDPSSRS